MIKKFRDISIININNCTISVACDSSAGIGALEKDIIKSDGYTVGYFSAFVPLAETISIGAEPILIINTLSVPNDNYGQSIIKGVMAAAENARLENDNCVTGSTEENFGIPFTSLGITVVGDFTNKKLPDNIQNSLDIYLIGLPKVGSEVLKDRHLILNLKNLLMLKSNSQIVDILPVGSKGIMHELNEMAYTLNADVLLDTSLNIDIFKSAGPATCAIAAIERSSSDAFDKVDIPVNKLGQFNPK